MRHLGFEAEAVEAVEAVEAAAAPRHISHLRWAMTSRMIAYDP